MSKLKEGDRAPDFTLPSQDGKEISLHDFFGKKSVVIYFYPKDFTMGCTAETRTFGMSYDSIVQLGAEVIGISSDTTESHRGFANECGARFILASDGGGKVRDLYGVQNSMGMIPGRVTFVIDKEGIVRKVYSSQLNPKKHVSEALETLKGLN
jgi:peroxiredoxin Q/BCP